MTGVRIKNATVFVTVLSACLAVVAAGASSQVRQTTSSVISEIASATNANLSFRQTSKEALKLKAVYTTTARPAAFASQSESSFPVSLYKNAPVFRPANQILVVTRLARASLDAYAL